jgi:Mrp family chromosome partitioning ATPase
MSKNFDLLQQLEREQFGSDSSLMPVLPLRLDDKADHYQKRRASDQALRLVQQIFLHQTHEPPRVVVFAAINHRDGCSHICTTVAKTLARNTLESVCLVEANLRSPSLPGFFGTTNHHGLTDAILREGPVKSFAKLVSGSNMWLLSSGAPVEDAASLIASDHLRQRLVELREQFGYVLFDAPPLTRYSDAAVLGQLSDGVVLVLEAESTREGATLAVADNLRSVNVRVLAAVLNTHSLPIP